MNLAVDGMLNINSLILVKGAYLKIISLFLMQKMFNVCIHKKMSQCLNEIPYCRLPPDKNVFLKIIFLAYIWWVPKRTISMSTHILSGG